MNHRRGALILSAGLILAAIGCRTAQPPDDRMLVAASIAPLADFARQIGGDKVHVVTIVPGSANPHTFEITPDIISRCSRARVLVLNGIGLEFWAGKLATTLQNPEVIIVTAGRGIALLEDDDHAQGNPHVWLDPLHAKRQMQAISDALVQADSAHASLYRQNTRRYLQKLDALHAEIEEEVKTWRRREFICFHPSWNYFANRYGLVQAAVIEKRPGFEPNPREMAELIELARRLQVRAIFAEKQFPAKISAAIAAESAAQVIALDPLGQDDDDFTYIELLRYNVQQMAGAMK